MKAIFLSEGKETVLRVFSENVRKELNALAEISPNVYNKKEVTDAPEKFKDVEIIFSTWGMPVFTEEEIKAYFPSLKCIFYAAGTVQAFARPFFKRGVRIFSAWAANAVPVAELTVAEIILAGKGFYAYTRTVRSYDANLAARKHRTPYPGNYGVRVGLIGCGMIGSLVAERLKSYDLDVVAFDPFLSNERAKTLGVTRVTLAELFATSQVVSNHLANNPETVGMLNYPLFAKMLPNSTFLNTGRGAQVVEEDLVRILRERPDITAVLDVTDPEPPIDDHPFYTLDNCFLTPHIAGSLENEVVRMAEYMLEEFLLYAKGAPQRYEVTEKMLATMA